MQILRAANKSFAHDHLVGWVDVVPDASNPSSAMLAIVTVERVALVNGGDGRLRQLVSLHGAGTVAVRDGTVLVVAYRRGTVDEMQLYTSAAANRTVLLVQEALLQ